MPSWSQGCCAAFAGSTPRICPFYTALGVILPAVGLLCFQLVAVSFDGLPRYPRSIGVGEVETSYLSMPDGFLSYCSVLVPFK
jgi:hypothetical protein